MTFTGGHLQAFETKRVPVHSEYVGVTIFSEATCASADVDGRR